MAVQIIVDSGFRVVAFAPQAIYDWTHDNSGLQRIGSSAVLTGAICPVSEGMSRLARNTLYGVAKLEPSIYESTSQKPVRVNTDR